MRIVKVTQNSIQSEVANIVYVRISLIFMYFFQADSAPIYKGVKMFGPTQWGLNRLFIYWCKDRKYNLKIRNLSWVKGKAKIYSKKVN